MLKLHLCDLFGFISRAIAQIPAIYLIQWLLILTPHQDMLAIRVLTQDFISASHFLNFTKTLSLSLSLNTSGKREVDAFSGLIYGGIWDWERKKESLVKGEKKPTSGVVFVMSQPCRFGLVSERDHHSVKGFSFISIFFNKLFLVARKGRKVNNGVTILLIELLGLNLIMFSLFLVFSLGIEIKSFIACIFVNCLKMLESL